MNDMTEQDLKELEAQTAAQEASWLPLQHIAATHPPVWANAPETVNSQSGSILGKGK